MRRAIKYIVVLALLASLGGCYLPVPNESSLEISDFNAHIFMVVGDNISDFRWYFDDQLLIGQNTFMYYYFPTASGTHTISASFKDGPVDRIQKWFLTIK